MNNIKSLRKKQNISVTELAERLGMSQSNLTKIENGQLELKPSVAQKIAQELNVSPTALQDTNLITNGYKNLDIINPEKLQLPILSTYPILLAQTGNIKKDCAIYLMPDDTMRPTISENSAVIIDKSIKTFTQNGIYLIINNGTTELRRLCQQSQTDIQILKDNTNYPPQSNDISNLNIIGKAIALHTYLCL